TMIVACALMGREGGIGRAAAGILPLVGALYWCIDGDAFLSQELWAGILIALSVCLCALDHWRLGLALRLAALFRRELALRFCLGAVYLPPALLGLAGWRGWTGARLALTAGLYIAAFAVVGQSFNDYWGLINAPLLAFGIAAAPEALHHLSMAIRG